MQPVYSQYNETLIQKINPNKSLLIHEELGEFTKQYDSGLYWFVTKKKIKIGYLTNRVNKCDALLINNQVIELEGKFENDALICELDITSFKVYTFNFNKRSYLILKVNNNGSGSSVNNVILNLFDVTNSKKILYYPLWSKFGSEECFGDFNKDLKLDFLKIGYYKFNYQFKGIQQTLTKNGIFKNFNTKNRYIIFQKIDDSLTITKRVGF